MKEHKNTVTAKIVENFYQAIEANFTYNDQLRSSPFEIPAQFLPSDSVSMNKYLLPMTINVTRFYMYALDIRDYDTAYSLLYKGQGSKIPTRETISMN